MGVASTLFNKHVPSAYRGQIKDDVCIYLIVQDFMRSVSHVILCGVDRPLKLFVFLVIVCRNISEGFTI